MQNPCLFVGCLLCPTEERILELGLWKITVGRTAEWRSMVKGQGVQPFNSRSDAVPNIITGTSLIPDWMFQIFDKSHHHSFLVCVQRLSWTCQVSVASVLARVDGVERVD